MKKLLALFLLFPGIALGQLDDDDPIRQAAIENAYSAALSFTADPTPPMSDITTLLNRFGESPNFLDPAVVTANQISNDPVQVDYDQEDTLFLTPATNTINTMDNYTIVSGDLVSSMWSYLTGGTVASDQALSCVGAGPCTAGTAYNILATNDGKLTVTADSVTTIWGFGLSENDPSSTTPTLANSKVFAQMGVDGCFDIYQDGAIATTDPRSGQNNAICGVLVDDTVYWEIDNTNDLAHFVHEGEIKHTIDNGGVFSTLYGTAVITTADSAALDNGVFDDDLQTLTTIDNMWTVLANQATRGLDIEATTAGGTGVSTERVLYGDNASYYQTLDTTAGASRSGFSDVLTGVTGGNIDFAMSYAFGEVRVYENGSIMYQSATGDDGEILEVRITDGEVTYHRGATLLYTSLVAVTGHMSVTNITIDTGAIIRNGSLVTSTGTQAIESSIWGTDGDAFDATIETEDLVDWSYAGYDMAETAPPTYAAYDIDVTDSPYLAIPDDGISDVAAFESAIAALGTDEILYIPDGVYDLDGLIKIDGKGRWGMYGESESGVIFQVDTYGSELGETGIDGGDASFWQFAGAFIWVDGTNAPGNSLATISVNAVRGTKAITSSADLSGTLSAGDEIRITAIDPASGGDQGELQVEIYKDVAFTESAFLLGKQLFDFVTRVEAIVGTTITLERPLPINIDASWDADIALSAPSVSEVHLQDFTIRFEESTYAGHGTALGYNGIQLDGCVNCSLQDITIQNADIGIRVSDSSSFTTVDDITLDLTASRGNYAGHHGIMIIQSQDNLFSDITFTTGTSYYHDFTVGEWARGTVSSRLTGPNVNFDFHRAANYQTLVTEANIGVADRLFESGGVNTNARYSGQRTTYWGITGTGTFDVPNFCSDFGGGYIALVAINTLATCATENWFADDDRYISPASIDPINLYDDQVLHLVPDRPDYVDTLVFNAPLTSDLSLTAGGSSMTKPTFGDADENRSVKNNLGYWRHIPAEAVRLWGARSVWNLASYTDDVSNAAWDIAVSVTVTGTNQVSYNATSDSIGQTLSSISNYDSLIGDTVSCSMDLNGDDTETVTIRISSIGGTSEVSDKQVTLNGTQTRFSNYLTTANADHTGYSCEIIRLVGDDVDGDLYIYDFQFENTTGNTDPTIPNAYVSNDMGDDHGSGADGFKYFSTTNGNMRNATTGVISTMAGTNIPAATLLGYMFEGEATEFNGRSYELGAWSLGGVAVTNSGTGLLGRTDELFVLTDDDGAAAEQMSKATTISADAGVYYAVYRFPLVETQTIWPYVWNRLTGGTAISRAEIVHLEACTLTNVSTAGTTTAQAYIDGTMCVVVIGVTNDSTNTNQTVYITPARNDDGTTTSDVAVTGATTVASIESYKDDWSFSPILTEGTTTKTRVEDRDLATPEFFNTNSLDTDGSMEITVTNLYTDKTGVANTVYQGDASFLYNAGGATYEHTIANTPTTNIGTGPATTVFETDILRMHWGVADDLLRGSLNGNAGAEVAYDGSWSSPAGIFSLGQGYTQGAIVKNWSFWNFKQADSWIDESPPIVISPTPSFVETLAINEGKRTYQTAALQSAYVPTTRGVFTIPYYNDVQYYKLTQDDECTVTTSDCRYANGYPYWKNINAFSGAEMHVFYGTSDGDNGGVGPVLQNINIDTDTVSANEPLFSSGSPYRASDTSGWFWSATIENGLYVPRVGLSYMERMTVDFDNPTTGSTFTTIFDLNDFDADLPATCAAIGCFIIQSSVSNDDLHFGFTVQDSSYATLGAGHYDVNADTLTFYAKGAYVYDEAQITKNGLHLIIKDDLNGDVEEDITIITLADETSRIVYGDATQTGAPGHSDTGYSSIFYTDNYDDDANSWERMDLTTDLSYSTEVFNTESFSEEIPAHLSWQNAKSPGEVHYGNQHACGATIEGLVGVGGTSQWSNEIICYAPGLNNGKVLVVGPSLGIRGSGADGKGGNGDYGRDPKGNLDVSGRYFFFTANEDGGDQTHMFIARIEHELLQEHLNITQFYNRHLENLRIQERRLDYRDPTATTGTATSSIEIDVADDAQIDYRLLDLNIQSCVGYGTSDTVNLTNMLYGVCLDSTGALDYYEGGSIVSNDIDTMTRLDEIRLIKSQTDDELQVLVGRTDLVTFTEVHAETGITFEDDLKPYIIIQETSYGDIIDRIAFDEDI